MRLKVILLFIVFTHCLITAKSQNRPIDILHKEDRVGFTGMFKYVNNNWNKSGKAKYGDLNFDSFRAWAQTDIENIFFASVQYRFYEGWQTPQHLYIGFHLKNTILKVGQIWVPFGMEWQPFDDWGNIAFYAGLQDDYDYGVTWEVPKNDFTLTLGFFKNQQLSSDSRWRYDADIYSGDITDDDDLILVQKQNEELNQLNVDLKYKYNLNGLEGEVGVSAMAGQIYNIAADDFGSRVAGTGYASVNKGIFHFNVQNIVYDFNQVLAPGAPEIDKDFINMSCWNVSYEIPRKANIFSTTAAVNIIDERLIYHINYSILSGGTSLDNSYLFTSGFSSFLGPLELFAEGYYGVGDPQFSGNTSGYGRDASIKDFRFDIRVYYKLSMLKSKDVKRPSKD